jgi:TonB family protein
MNRLQKKCFIASAGIHLLLGLVLFIGPAFVPSKSKTDDLPILNFVPLKTVDELIAPGGGSPKARPVATAPIQQPAPQPAVTPPPPALQPEPAKVPEPDPPKDVQPAKRPDDSLELSKEKPTKKIEISTKLIDRTQANAERNAEKKAREEAQAKAEAKAAADARRRLARQIGQAAAHIGSELSGGTSVELAGPGGGGVPYANWIQAVKSDFANAWLLPDGVVDDEATTVASVTIGRDGTVISSTIRQLSADSVVDRSVQATLDRVRRTAPLPDTAKEDKRTVTIKFNVRAKRALG